MRTPSALHPVVRGLAVAGVSAGLWAASFPPLGVWALGWFALVPLFCRLVLLSPGRAAGLAAAWAALATLGVAWWFPATVAGFFGAGAGSGLAGLAVLAGLDAALYAPFGAWLGACGRRGRASPLAVGAAFTLAEFVRSRFWIANPFALAAAAQTEGPWLQLVDLVGAFGLGWLVVTTNAVVAGFWSPAFRGSAPWRRRTATVVCLLAGLGYGLVKAAAPAVGSSARVGVVQTLPPSHAPSQGPSRLERQLALSREALDHGAELVLWPEYAVDFYLREAGPERDRLLALTAETPLELAVGAPHYRVGDGGGLRYTTSVFLLRDGQVVGRSDKTHLVPFAESAPLGLALAAPGARYSPGEGARVLEAREVALGSLICSEAFFSDVARRLVRGGAELLSNPSNDAWYGNAAGAAHQLQAAILRAVENGRPLVRPAAAGASVHIDSRGRVRDLLPGRDEGVAVVHFTRPTGHTVYNRLGDGAVWLAAFVAAAPWFPTALLRRRSR